VVSEWDFPTFYVAIMASFNRTRSGKLLRIFAHLAAHRRSSATDAVLGTLLAFIAGAVNAGGFIAIGKYTSHMTGILSAMADDVALGGFGLAGIGLLALACFMTGAGVSAILINWGRRNVRSRQYVYPLFLEAVLLICFAAAGLLQPAAFIAIAAPLLCFVMGLQNATITKISGARVRTTHVTGMVTDIGIELGKSAYWSQGGDRGKLPVRPNLNKLAILSQMVGMFFAGGVIGAIGYGFFGYAFSIPIAALLLAMVLPVIVRSHNAII
jgi:uncharacterized membrane protein YoaK (UPF0700 family)